jgi:sporulation protein YlmC with PRC-barrel domain
MRAFRFSGEGVRVMLLVVSSLKGYQIEATDGLIGTVSDFLFDDRTWKIRWMVVDTGHWLTGRKVLIHPSAIGEPDFEAELVHVHLTQQKIKDSPDIMQDAPVTEQMEDHLYGYYGWDPMWGGAGYLSGGMIGYPLLSPLHNGGELREADRFEIRPNDGDPYLRSADAVKGYHIRATDETIGHVENFLVDDATWTIRYLIVDTRNWWPGKHVLLAPFAVRQIDWSSKQIRVNISSNQVKDAPAWDPLEQFDQAYERRLHTHYGWPGYGW